MALARLPVPLPRPAARRVRRLPLRAAEPHAVRDPHPDHRADAGHDRDPARLVHALHPLPEHDRRPQGGAGRRARVGARDGADAAADVRQGGAAARRCPRSSPASASRPSRRSRSRPSAGTSSRTAWGSRSSTRSRQPDIFKTELVAAGLLVIGLALVADALLMLLQRALTPWGRAAVILASLFVDSLRFIPDNASLLFHKGVEHGGALVRGARDRRCASRSRSVCGSGTSTAGSSSRWRCRASAARCRASCSSASPS